MQGYGVKQVEKAHCQGGGKIVEDMEGNQIGTQPAALRPHLWTELELA